MTFRSHALINPFRSWNPVSTRTKVILLSSVVIGVGVTVFLSTRRAAAASQAAVAFSVSPDCMRIEIKDEGLAKGAAAAAAIVVHPSPGDPALNAAREVLSVVLPQCDWMVEIPPDRTFVHGSSSYTWAQIEALLGSRTVGELSDLVGSQNQLVASPVPRLFSWLLFVQLPPPPTPKPIPRIMALR